MFKELKKAVWRTDRSEMERWCQCASLHNGHDSVVLSSVNVIPVTLDFLYLLDSPVQLGIPILDVFIDAIFFHNILVSCVNVYQLNPIFLTSHPCPFRRIHTRFLHRSHFFSQHTSKLTFVINFSIPVQISFVNHLHGFTLKKREAFFINIRSCKLYRVKF